MLNHTTKLAYYALLSPAMRLSGVLYRTLLSPRSGTVRVQLGPGKQKYLDGWINVDANFISAKLDVWADLRNPLPFRDGTVDAFYSHHVIEHLPDTLLPFHFSEMFRCLKPGGAIRVGGPDGEQAARKLLEGDDSWFTDFPDKRTSVGGKYVNFVMCRGEHLTILTRSYLSEIASNAGFDSIRPCQPILETNFPHLFDSKLLANEWETTPEAPHTLLIEAKKSNF